MTMCLENGSFARGNQTRLWIKSRNDIRRLQAMLKGDDPMSDLGKFVREGYSEPIEMPEPLRKQEEEVPEDDPVSLPQRNKD